MKGYNVNLSEETLLALCITAQYIFSDDDKVMNRENCIEKIRVAFGLSHEEMPEFIKQLVRFSVKRLSLTSVT